ncbi:MAG: NeuD/PglB/VioB family sugar acetyltransferase [Rikenellaceae bacterium]|nr:NeuD/PglB/VioB family sugar acetyltransferase [Rikenellaceae bacterium]
MEAIIIGAGSYGEVYAAYLQEAGIDVHGFIDDNPLLHGKSVKNIPVLGGIEYLQQLKSQDKYHIYCPIGNNSIRVKLLSYARSLGYTTPNFIHKTAYISPNVSIASEGVYILANVTIMPYAEIERDVMISIGANIAHHSILAQGTFVSSGVTLGATIETGENAYIGMGATIMTGVKRLGNNSLIGAGAVVIRDVNDNAIMAGVPAKLIRYK